MGKTAVLFVLVFVVSVAIAQDLEADSLVRGQVQAFMDALQSGDGETAASMFSSIALQQVEVMLNTIKQSLDRDPEGTMSRLSSAGYSVELAEAERWETEVYLAQTLSLPMISARYTPYEMTVEEVLIDGRTATVQMIFSTASGAQIPQQAILTWENDVWKISNFMGITAFP